MLDGDGVGDCVVEGGADELGSGKEFVEGEVEEDCFEEFGGCEDAVACVVGV